MLQMVGGTTLDVGNHSEVPQLSLNPAKLELKPLCQHDWVLRLQLTVLGAEVRFSLLFTSLQLRSA